MKTDTESFELSTRTNSLLFSSVSGTSSMSSYVNVSEASGSDISRKRRIDYTDASATTTPPKARRMSDGPQTPVGPLTPSNPLVRCNISDTCDFAQKIYPNIVEDNVFWISPAEKPSRASISSTSDTIPRKKVTAMDSIFLSNRPQPSTSASLPTLNQQAKASLGTCETSPETIPPPPVVLTSSSDQAHPSASTSIPPLNSQTEVQPISGGPTTSTKPPPEPVVLDLDFLKIVAGGDLPFCIVAHDDEVQNLMDARHICLGAQWDIARGVSNGLWKWSDVTSSKLDLLRGSNVEAAWKVSSIMRSQIVPQVVQGNLEIW